MLEVLDEGECLDLLGSAPVGRVAVSIDAVPAVLPVNFVLHGREILFHTRLGTKLGAAVARTVVAFEVDELGGPAGESWSVLVVGRAEEITHPAIRDELEPLLPQSWALDEGAHHLVRISISQINGRLVRPDQPAD
jgi:nitroimidazol reductase NimA-like FMN-containing flavoprotein (pyridoxamine 5'-phosphate oxidase superfamily)